MEQYILNEMYFGKLPGLVKIEDYFIKLQQKYKKSNMMQNLSAYREILKDPILLKISYELMDLFGFKEVTVTIARDDTFNAYTIPFVADDRGNSYNIEDEKVPFKKLQGSIIVTNSGFRFDKKKFPVNLLVVINLGILFGDKVHRLAFTIPELIAVLLHEIGHNFSLATLGTGMNKAIKSNEIFADSFAAMYGYGQEFSTAFNKLGIRYSNFDKNIKDTPILNIIVGLKHIASGILTANPDDPHPAIKNRLDNVLKQMEADLKETPNLTPGMREDLKKQIEFCKKINAVTYDANDNDSTGIRMTKYFYREMEPGWEEHHSKDSDKLTNPTKLNKKIGGMMKPKGFFRFK